MNNYGDSATDHVATLEQLGFTTYEARAWLALNAMAEANGYEVAKHSGIPRANVYPILNRLVERGAARCTDTQSGKRYVATPAQQMIRAMREEQQKRLAVAEQTLPHKPRNTDEHPVFALQSRAQVQQAAQRIIRAARHKLFIALQPPEARALAADLYTADERGVKITTLCMEACATECGGCRGTIHRCDLAPPDAQRWLIVAADNECTVAAELTETDTVRAVETRQPLIVKLATSYIRQSAALSILGGELGDRFEGLVSLQARHLLDGLQRLEAASSGTPEGGHDNPPGQGHSQEQIS